MYSVGYNTYMDKKRIAQTIIVAELALLVPLIGMIVSDDIQWGLIDFLFAGILLAGLGCAYALTTHGIKNNTKQAVIGIVLVVSLLLIWAELAVGLFR